MNVLKNKMQRREFLRGLAMAGMAVPFASQFLVAGKAHAAGNSAKRLIVVFYPNGCKRDSWHSYGDQLNEASLANSPLLPLAPYADRMVAFKNLSFIGHGGSSGHPEACRGVFSGGHEYSPTIDVAIGEALNAGTLNNNLHMGLWSSQKTDKEYHPFTDKNGNKIIPNDDPQSIYDKYFASLGGGSGGETDPATESRKRVLETLHENLDVMQTYSLNAKQTAKLQTHEESLDYLQRVLNSNLDLSGLNRPSVGMTGINDEAELVAQAQMRNIAYAMEYDLTRVATFQFMSAQDESLKVNFESIHPYMGDFAFPPKLTYNETKSHVSSHNENNLFDAQTRWYNMMVKYLCDELAARQDPTGGGTLLDTTMILMMSEMGGGNHQQENPGVYVVGGGNGAINQGVVVDAGNRGSSNLFLDLAKGMGLGWSNYGNSNGGIPGFLA
ncbi:DUF1552 domain-containing protein [Corallincola spongiicola]|uniref:DUF1552 domain-containing protein n=1 Tax=Corallincola spongiicola TaxID=2520508 RepID=A0ABY1WSK0_9GAMM|nr:DUF1552 domain-containing protein [Corallincola spongiicola]TAA47509.1 DUF1552 domain-containing protein [Corallincola spongiicola]